MDRKKYSREIRTHLVRLRRSLGSPSAGAEDAHELVEGKCGRHVTEPRCEQAGSDWCLNRCPFDPSDAKPMQPAGLD